MKSRKKSLNFDEEFEVGQISKTNNNYVTFSISTLESLSSKEYSFFH